MLYRSANIIDQQRAKRQLDELFQKDCLFEITERKERRTGQQNRYFYLLLTYFAMETGYSVQWIKEEYFKRHCNPEIFIRSESGKLGTVEYLRSSASLDTAEMTTAIERFRNKSSEEAGIYLPAANEHKFLQQIEIEAQRYKEFI